jgi:hypothetical protein
VKKETLNDAAHEARRFLKAVNELAVANEKFTAAEGGTQYKHFDIKLAKYTAAVRRSSLDLTKTLARLRQER